MVPALRSGRIFSICARSRAMSAIRCWDGRRPRACRSSVEISEKLPAFAVGDPVRLRAALENLIDNAVKFTEQASSRAGGHGDAPRQGQDRNWLCGFRQRHRPDACRGQAPVPAVLAGQRLDRLALRRRGARTVLGQAIGAGDGRRHGRDPAQGRRHHLYAHGRADARCGAGHGRVGRRERCVAQPRRRRCGCSASKTIRSAASCSTPF